MIIKKLFDGLALEKFKEIITAQGGDISFIDDLAKYPKAKYYLKLSSQEHGYINSVDAGKIARRVKILSTNGDGSIDYTVDLSGIMKIWNADKAG